GDAGELRHAVIVLLQREGDEAEAGHVGEELEDPLGKVLARCDVLEVDGRLEHALYPVRMALELRVRRLERAERSLETLLEAPNRRDVRLAVQHHASVRDRRRHREDALSTMALLV